MAFHLFSTESLDCVSTGCQLSRVEKTRWVSGFEPSWRHLNVCVDPAFEGRNCSVCFKCCRTLLTLELLKKEHLYANVFDLDRFRSVRREYVNSVILKARHDSHESEYESEIVRLAIDVGDEQWADTLRRRAAHRAVVEKVKGLARSTDLFLGQVARKLRGR